MPEKTLRILIADDHDIMRQGERAVIERHPGWEVPTATHENIKSLETRG